MCATNPPNEDRRHPEHYEIRIQGHLQDRWAGWFGDMAILRQENGETCLRGPVEDQAALHGILRKVRDTGMTLLSVARILPSQAGDDPSTQS